MGKGVADTTRGPRRGGRSVATVDPPTLPAGAHVVLHIRLPDRPGGLGAVAARIGAIGADITDVSVARRDTGSAVDVFHLTLPDADVDLLSLLLGELSEVDGAGLEDWSLETCCGTGSA